MDPSDRRRRASEEAAAWWVRLQTGEFARAEREEFVDWLRESAVHVAEMLRVAKVHGALEQFQGWAKIATDAPDDDGDGDNENVVSLPPHPKSASSLVTLPPAGGEEHRKGVSLSDRRGGGRDEAFPGTTRRRIWLGAIAASLAVAATLGVLFYPMLREQTIQTERGERRAVALADGSVVEVDPQSRLRVAFEKHTRRVFLEKGRALFRVAKNPERPFLVQADGTTVRAVGTAFGVERKLQGVVVTVAEGKVAVLASGSPLPEVNEVSKEGETTPNTPRGARQTRSVLSREVLLTAGQQVTMRPSGATEPVRKVDSDRELAWAKGRLVFADETVATAVEKFNRYNRIQLHVGDEALARRPVSGVFDASDPESFIAFLQTVTSVHVIRSDSEIIMQ
jgi:transmembrane sensor